MKNGVGTEISEDGSTFQGLFINGLKQGNAKYISKEGVEDWWEYKNDKQFRYIGKENVTSNVPV